MTRNAHLKSEPILKISLSAVVNNWKILQTLAPTSKMGATVKANAYGMGIDYIVPALATAGCTIFFVATLSEGIELRHCIGPKPTIYVLSGFLNEPIELWIKNILTPVLNSLSQLFFWNEQVFGDSQAGLQIDCGMARLGFSESQIEYSIENPSLLHNVTISLIMGHLACSDEPQNPLNTLQRLSFEKGLLRLRNLKSCQNSLASLAATHGLFLGPEYTYDLARPGIGLYGGCSLGGLKSVVTLECPVVQIQSVLTGGSVGYGASFQAKRHTRVATVAGGYADGFSRTLSNKGTAWFLGQKVPLIGRVNMDLMTFDVTDSPVQEGDFLELLGPHCSVEALARDMQTIPYEVLTNFRGARFKRIFVT